jgi:hypothetical protein
LQARYIPILAPIIQREIVYRVLVGDQGACLRQMASAGKPESTDSAGIVWVEE